MYLISRSARVLLITIISQREAPNGRHLACAPTGIVKEEYYWNKNTSRTDILDAPQLVPNPLMDPATTCSPKSTSNPRLPYPYPRHDIHPPSRPHRPSPISPSPPPSLLTPILHLKYTHPPHSCALSTHSTPTRGHRGEGLASNGRQERQCDRRVCLHP